MKKRHRKLEHGFLHRIQIKFNTFCNLRKIYNQIKSVGSSNIHQKETILKLYLTKQLLTNINVLQLWSECGLTLILKTLKKEVSLMVHSKRVEFREKCREKCNDHFHSLTGWVHTMRITCIFNHLVRGFPPSPPCNVVCCLSCL